MTKAEKEIIAKANKMVKKLNRVLKVRQPIVVKNGKIPGAWGQTFLHFNPFESHELILNAKDFLRHPESRLYLTIYHEMLHIALWPLTKKNDEDTRLFKYEESVVVALTALMEKALYDT